MKTPQLMLEDQRWIERPTSEFRCKLPVPEGERTVEFTAQFFTHRVQRFLSRESYEHPTAWLTRIFLVPEGHVSIRANRTRTALRPAHFYLLPMGLPFASAYGPALVLTHELHICDPSGLPVFDPALGIVSIHSPELAARTLKVMTDPTQAALRPAVALETLVHLLLPTAPTLALRQQQTARFRPVIEQIQKSPPGTIRIEELAATYGGTANALSKSFRRSFGIPLKQYLSQVTLARAKERLLTTDQSATAIALELGFDDPPYFWRVFRRTTGLSPGEYRESHRSGI